jgi:transposase
MVLWRDDYCCFSLNPWRIIRNNVFKKWFSSILHKFENSSVLVLDNAPYHCVKVERIPTKSWTNTNIQKWTDMKGISYESKWICSKLELLVAMPQHICAACNSYCTDQAAVKYGRQVLRLPPHHCSLSPIKLVLSQVKWYVARNNAKFTITEVKEQPLQGVQCVTPDNWKSWIQHVISIKELNMWMLDGLVRSDATHSHQFIIG